MIYELLSKRTKKQMLAGSDDVFQYDTVSQHLRVQIQQILSDAIGPQYEIDPYIFEEQRHNPDMWNEVHNLLCREIGVHRLPTIKPYAISNEGVLNYLGSALADDFLDTLEVCCRVLSIIIINWPSYELASHGIKQAPQLALDEINYRMREANFGYAYDDGQMFRVDSTFSHEEVIKPALKVLRGVAFAGPQSEFLQAHRHFHTTGYHRGCKGIRKHIEGRLRPEGLVVRLGR